MQSRLLEEYNRVVVKAKKKAPVPVTDTVYVSEPLVIDSTWQFTWNDQRITYDQYTALCNEHNQWCKQQDMKEHALDV